MSDDQPPSKTDDRPPNKTDDRNPDEQRKSTPDEQPRKKTVALVLGSGGARGYAHIGVVDAVQAAGYEIVAIAGSSMGAVVGGLTAAGKLAEFEEWTRGLGRSEVFRLMDVSLTSGGIRGEKVFQIVGELVGDIAIEDLPIDFTAVAVDLLAQREVWFKAGPLHVALRASSAIPSLFVPVTLNGQVFVDGGLLNPVPVAPVAAARADLIVAVTLNGQGPIADRPVAESAAEVSEEEWSRRFRGAAVKWFDGDLAAVIRRRLSPERQEILRNRLIPDEAEPKPRKADKADELGTMEIMQASIEAMQGALTRHRLAGYSPDILVSVPKNACRTFDFHRADEMIELGRDLATTALGSMESSRYQ